MRAAGVSSESSFMGLIRVVPERRRYWRADAKKNAAEAALKSGDFLQ